MPFLTDPLSTSLYLWANKKMIQNPYEYIALDLDGTLLNLQDFKNPKPRKFRLDTIKKLQSLGLPIVIISNQLGIEKGYLSLESFINQVRWVFRTCDKLNLGLFGFYFCPNQGQSCFFVDSAGGNFEYCIHENYRKPNIGMALDCEKKFGKPSLYVGDFHTDKQFAHNAGWYYQDINDFVSNQAIVI